MTGSVTQTNQSIFHERKLPGSAARVLVSLLLTTLLFCFRSVKAEAALVEDTAQFLVQYNSGEENAAVYGTTVQADIDGDGKSDSVSVQDIRDRGDAFTRVTAWTGGHARAQEDYGGHYASFLAACDLTGDGKAEILSVRYSQEGFGELELSVLHFEDGEWKAYPGRFVHNGEIALHQPWDFTDSWHDTYVGAAVVKKDGKNLLRFIVLPDDKDAETVLCVDASYYSADGWLVEDVRLVDNYYEGGKDKILLQEAYVHQHKAMQQAARDAVSDAGEDGQKVRPKKTSSDADKAAVMKIIEQQRAAGVLISTNLEDALVYTWTVLGNERRLTGINWEDDEIRLRLYLAREVLSKQGGYVKIKSEIGEGTTVQLYLSRYEV